MTEPATSKLGQPSGDTFAAALGGYAAEVDLLSEEIPLHAWEVAYGRVWENAWGILYLTSHRLVWIRSKIALPWIAKTLEIPLDSVIAAKARRRWWWPIPFDRGLVVISRKDAESCQFSPSWSSPGAKEIAGEITSILRERGLLRD